jgi:acetamidase/formamidase
MTWNSTQLRVVEGIVLAVCFTPSGVWAQTTHYIKASPETVQWGFFDASQRPVLSIKSGDIVDVETVLDGADFMRSTGISEEFIRPEMKEIDAKVKDRGPGGHVLVGPIQIEGASRGDVLQIEVIDVQPADSYAVNIFVPGLGTIPKQFPWAGLRVIPIDATRNVAQFSKDIEIPLKPFFGVMGVAPPRVVGRIGSTAPGYFGGNLDDKELSAGSTLYLPVHVAGALFSVGDGHAGQGDGEADGSALEMAVRGKLRITVRKDLKARWPRAENADFYMTMGLDADLDTAAELAVTDMVDYLVSERKLTRDEAYMITSMAVDLHVTELVDDVKGVHAMLPKRIFVSH